MLYVTLSDGRQIGLPLRRTKWLRWLAHATPRQRKRWAIEPLGDAIYWNELDDSDAGPPEVGAGPRRGGRWRV